MKLIIFTNLSFANNHDYTSQISFVIMLINKDNKANIIHWLLIKYKRVTQSVLVSELYRIAHGFNVRATIKLIIKKILQINTLLLVLYTNSKSLYNCLVKLGTM